MIVTVVPVSEAEVIGLVGPAQIEGRPVAHDVPVGHAGDGLVAVKASVAGLYNYAQFEHRLVRSVRRTGRRRCQAGTVCPVEPPTISTCPSSAVPLPEIRVALDPLRAIVVGPAACRCPRRSLFVCRCNSAVCSALHWKPTDPRHRSSVRRSCHRDQGQFVG